MPRDPVVYTLKGEGVDNKGHFIAVVGDADSDGAPDFAASALHKQPDGTYPGRVDLHSGRDGRLLQSWTGSGNDAFGDNGLWAFPDLDGDGVLELGAKDSSSTLRLFSPVTGATWYRVEKSPSGASPGRAFLIIPDVDGDGTKEYLGGNDLASPIPALVLAGRLVLYSGRTGQVLWTRWGTTYDGALGLSSVIGGDEDGDGLPDILTAEIEEFPDPSGAPFRRNVVRIISSRSGALLRTYRPGLPRLFGFGAQIVSLGDRDRDGFPEVAISAPSYRDVIPPLVGPAPRFVIDSVDGQGLGWVGIFRLPDFELLFAHKGLNPQFLTVEGDRLGQTLAVAGDLDGDGLADLLAGTNRALTAASFWYGRLYAISGADGSTLAVHEFRQYFDYFVQTLSPLGDVDGDGRDEFVIASSEEDSAGVIRVLTYHPEAPRFIRGDANGDGKVGIADAALILRLANSDICTSRGPLPPGLPDCPAAFDADGNGCISRLDAVWLLNYLFIAFELAPTPPFPGCGQFYRVRVKGDEVSRHLECRNYDVCSDR